MFRPKLNRILGLTLILLLTACTQTASPPALTQPSTTDQPTIIPVTAPSETPSSLLTAHSPLLTTSPTPTAPLPTASPVPISTTPLEGPALLEALRHGGYVIYFRHAATDRTQADSDTQNLENCQTQRNLNDQGRADARLIGEAFRALAIPVGKVLSSAYCRTRETAELAFSQAELTQDLTGFPADLQEERIAALTLFLSTPPDPGANTVLVAHGFNITNTADITLSEGEAAIFAPLGPDGFILIARLQPNQWSILESSGQ